MKRLHYGLAIVFLIITLFAKSQDFSNKGKEFWLAYSYHVGMVNGGGEPAMTLYLTSDVNTAYNVEIYGVATLQSGNITAGQVVTVNVPNAYFINNEGTFTNKAIRVTGDKSIVVYSFITRSAASAAASNVWPAISSQAARWRMSAWWNLTFDCARVARSVAQTSMSGE